MAIPAPGAAIPAADPPDTPEPGETRYASPEAVVADTTLSCDQKQRFLSDWLAEARQATDAGGTGAAFDAELVGRLEASLSTLNQRVRPRRSGRGSRTHQPVT